MVFVTPGKRKRLLGNQVADKGKIGEAASQRQYPESTPDRCCPVIWGDLLFIVTDNGIAQCIDARTGEQKWRERHGGKFKASPVAADGREYFLDQLVLATVIAASPVFEKVAENQLDDETTASPAISQGRIYIRGRGHLYCVGK